MASASGSTDYQEYELPECRVKKWILPMIRMDNGGYIRFHDISYNKSMWKFMLDSRAWTLEDFKVALNLVPLLLPRHKVEDGKRKIELFLRDYVPRQAYDVILDSTEIENATDYWKNRIQHQILPARGSWKPPKESLTEPPPYILYEPIIPLEKDAEEERECCVCKRTREELLAWAKIPCTHDICVECDCRIRFRSQQRGEDPKCPVCRQTTTPIKKRGT